MTDLTFEKAIQECCGKEKHLLLGNGFSINFDPSFNYPNLLSRSNLHVKIKDIFNKQGDYEQVIDRLNYSSKVFNAINEYSLAKRFSNLAKDLKRDLVTTITKIQSKVHNDDNRNHNTLKFISNFNNIFTLNYDLLLYWVIMYAVNFYHEDLFGYKNYVKNPDFYPRDGFANNPNGDDCIWEKDKWEQNVFYLHGGLHLFYDSQNTYKLISDRNNNQSISDKTIFLLNQGISPLVITEGNSKDKKFWIDQNDYLQYCYNKLSEINGVLFIQGHSLNETDQHIFDAINNNPNIQEIYISIHPESGETIDKKSKLAEDAFNCDKINLHFYDADSAHIW